MYSRRVIRKVATNDGWRGPGVGGWNVFMALVGGAISAELFIRADAETVMRGRGVRCMETQCRL